MEGQCSFVYFVNHTVHHAAVPTGIIVDLAHARASTTIRLSHEQ